MQRNPIKDSLDSKKENNRPATLDTWRLARFAAFQAVALDTRQADLKRHVEHVQKLLQDKTNAVISRLYQPEDKDKDQKSEPAWHKYNRSPQGIVARILTYCIVNRFRIDKDHITAMTVDPQQYLSEKKKISREELQTLKEELQILEKEYNKSFFQMAEAWLKQNPDQENFPNQIAEDWFKQNPHPRQKREQQPNFEALPEPLLKIIKPWIEQAKSGEENFQEWNNYYNKIPQMLPPIVPLEEVFALINSPQNRVFPSCEQRFNLTMGVQCFCLLLLQKLTAQPLMHSDALFGCGINREKELGYRTFVEKIWAAIHSKEKSSSNDFSLSQLEAEIQEDPKSLPDDHTDISLYHYIKGLMDLRALVATHQFVVVCGPEKTGKSAVCRLLGFNAVVSPSIHTKGAYTYNLTPTIHLVDTPYPKENKQECALDFTYFLISMVANVAIAVFDSYDISTVELLETLGTISKTSPIKVITLLNKADSCFHNLSFNRDRYYEEREIEDEDSDPMTLSKEAAAEQAQMQGTIEEAFAKGCESFKNDILKTLPSALHSDAAIFTTFVDPHHDFPSSISLEKFSAYDHPKYLAAITDPDHVDITDYIAMPHKEEVNKNLCQLLNPDSAKIVIDYIVPEDKLYGPRGTAALILHYLLKNFGPESLQDYIKNLKKCRPKYFAPPLTVSETPKSSPKQEIAQEEKQGKKRTRDSLFKQAPDPQQEQLDHDAGVKKIKVGP